METPTSGGGFTTKEILIEFRQEVRSEFEDLKKSFTVAQDDHETRIRSLERFKNAVPSTAALALIVSIASAAIAITH